MRRVLKYPLYMDSRVSIPLPKGSDLLHVGFQRDELMLWALVNSDAPMITRSLLVLGTGFEMSEEDFEYYSYMCTCLNKAQDLVLHIFVNRP